MEGTNELWCRLDVPEEQGSASANAWFVLPLLLTSVPEDGTAPIKYEVEGTNKMYDFLLSVCVVYTRYMYTQPQCFCFLLQVRRVPLHRHLCLGPPFTTPSPDYRYLFSSPVWKETWTLY